MKNCHTKTGTHSHINTVEDHSRAVRAGYSVPEIISLLDHMLAHHRHHIKDLREMHNAIECAGHNDASSHLHEAISIFESGNEKIAEALRIIRGE